MKTSNRTNIILLLLMGLLGFFMWTTAIEQSKQISEQGQHIATLRDNLDGVRAGASTQAELILNTKYCTDDPEKALCVQAAETLELINHPASETGIESFPTFECSTTGQWIITYPNGEVGKPEGLCRADPTTELDPTPTPKDND